MAKVLSSISGNLISAASAGFAPTNSGDVSAIASGYQVVSATATQLYAGTAFLTEVNGATVSASRAGQAANASMANSAYYDGTGRLISALPDSAAVSSIASSYAESAASGKLDSTAEVVTATAGDGTYVTSINGLGISGQGGGGGVTVDTASARTMYSAADGSAVTGFSGIDGVGPIVLGPSTVVSPYNAYMLMQFGNSSTNQYTGTVYQSSVDGDANYRWATGNIILMSSTMGYGYYKGHQLWLCRGPYSASHRISFDVNNTTADVMVYKNGNSAVITPSGFAIWGPTTAAADRRRIDSAAVDRWNSYSAKQDALAFAYTTADQISSINGSALGGMDEAAVSGIASAYAESAVSSKLDTTAFNSADFYMTANESGFVGSAYVDSAVSGKADSSSLSSYALSSDVSGVIDTVSTNSASWGQGGVDSATVSAIASSYAESAASSKLDTTAQVVTATAGDGTYITSINGLGISGQGGGGATGDYVEKSANEVTIGNGNSASTIAFAQGGGNSATTDSFAQGEQNSANYDSFAQGYYNTASDVSFAQGDYNTASYYSIAQGQTNSASYNSFVQGQYNSASDVSFAQGYYNTASDVSFAQGDYNTAINTAVVFGQYNLRGDGSTASGNSAAFAIGDGTASTARHDLMLVTKNGEITMYSSTADTVGTGIMSSIRAISAAATGGGVDSATVSSIASSYAKSAASSKLDTTAQVVTATGSASVGSWGWNTAMVSSINGSAILPYGYSALSANSANWTSVYNTVSSNSASWGASGVDSATVSAIASGYAESAASSKLDSTAFNSGDFYTTANESGYVDSAYVDSAVSGKMDSSAIDYTRTGGGTQIYASGTGSSTNQFSAKNDSAGAAIIAGENARLRLWDTAATANLYASSIGSWNAASNLVSSQSANWGGSALALSAGPGVKLEKSGNVLLVQADENLLWSGANTSAATLSEPYSNFERIGVVLGFPNQGKTYHVFEAESSTQLMYAFGQTNAYLCAIKCGITDGTAFKVNDAKYVWSPYGTSTQVATDTGNVASAKNCLIKIYGINRTAGV